MPPIEKLPGSERVTVPGHLMRGSGDHYVLRVVGDLMADEAILDGDFVIVLRRDYAEDGEIAVCLIGDDATIKRVFHEEGEYLRLESCLPGGGRALRCPAEGVKIQGVVVGLMRKF